MFRNRIKGWFKQFPSRSDVMRHVLVRGRGNRENRTGSKGCIQFYINGIREGYPTVKFSLRSVVSYLPSFLRASYVAYVANGSQG